MKKVFKNLSYSILIIVLFVSGAIASQLWNNPNNIRVYIPQNDDKTQLMKNAFDDWRTKTYGKIGFQYVNNPSASQIDVVFIEKDLTKYCGTSTAMGCAITNHNNGELHSKIYIAKRRPKGLLLSNTQVYSVMRHEIGHALGLNHRSSPLSIMYSGTNLGIAARQKIQTDDVKALFNLYGLTYQK